MTKNHINYDAVETTAETSPSQISPLSTKTPDDKQQALNQELKSSGSIDIPVQYTKTHL